MRKLEKYLEKKRWKMEGQNEGKVGCKRIKKFVPLTLKKVCPVTVDAVA